MDRNGFYNSSKADMLEVLEKNKLLLKIKEHYKSSIFGLLYNNKNIF